MAVRLLAYELLALEGMARDLEGISDGLPDNLSLLSVAVGTGNDELVGYWVNEDGSWYWEAAD